MKKAFKWLKEKWLLPAAGFFIIAYAIFFKTNRRNVDSLRKLNQQNTDTVRQLEEINSSTASAIDSVEQTTTSTLQDIDEEHQNALDEIRKHEEELLAKYELKTNVELAELLKGKKQ